MGSRSIVSFAIAAALGVASGAAHGQYKWVAPDGTPSYGDRPPPERAEVLTGPGTTAAARSGGDSQLPYALRAAVTRFPVAIYTTQQCSPCDAARKHLGARGVPFTERVLRTQADLEALKRQGFSDASVPALAVGRERLSGFEAGAWDALLDAASYPKRSMLPVGWKPRPAEPMSPDPATERESAVSKDDASSREPMADDSPRALPMPVSPPSGAGGVRF